MSNIKCPQCNDRDVYITPYPPPESDIASCYKCGYTGLVGEFPEQNLFDRITTSPEVLAAKLVYHDEAHEIAFSVVIRGKEQRMGHECWRSTIIPGACWAEYDRAYAAMVARLKEVADEHTAE